ncbi:MAG: DEAD/DEAH box helicase [Candidatus Nanopelagicales bacterium]
MAFLRKVKSAVTRVRQDPGTEDTGRLQNLVDEIRRQREELSHTSDSDIMKLAATLPAANKFSDNAEQVMGLAVLCETYKRTVGLDPFDVQVLAALNMLRGIVVNMATGEGKTLVGHLVAAGLACRGDKVHVLSANTYLAGRDAEWGKPFFDAFGFSVATVIDSMTNEDRRKAFGTDIVYTTIHQVGFDLLRDRQRTSNAERLIGKRDAVIVDEIDAVLLDDAMVPLVLAGERPSGELGSGDSTPAELEGVAEAWDGSPPPDISAETLAEFIRGLERDVDYEVDPDNRSTSFLDPGFTKLEKLYEVDDIFTPESAGFLGQAYTALHAHALLTRDVHYVVTDDRIKLINESRGRVEELQRWPDGLHSAVEVKEAVTSTADSLILDQVLVQTVVKGYGFVTGMSGTAVDAAEQLLEDFNVRAGSIPTNVECSRVDEPDELFITNDARDAAAAERISEAHADGQPVLVGTPSVQDSERFASLLVGLGLQPVVLNAKNDADEAEIIARAGEAGTVTISTQMAGRGVDILLDDAAHEAGGLLVLSLGRYDSRRLDHQLRGRSGRQGDPGSTVFFTSMDDEVVTENLDTDIHDSQIGDSGRIVDSELLGIYEHAQRRAEGKTQQAHRKTRDFNIVVDNNRASILARREELLTSDEALGEYLSKLNLESTSGTAHTVDWTSGENRDTARQVVLFEFDRAWADHLEYLTHVREGIHLRALGRENPLDEYNKLAGADFQRLPGQIRDAVSSSLDLIAESGVNDLTELGLKRPTATWTYMVEADPFGSPEDNITQFIANKARGGDGPKIRYR